MSDTVASIPDDSPSLHSSLGDGADLLTSLYGIVHHGRQQAQDPTVAPLTPAQLQIVVGALRHHLNSFDILAHPSTANSEAETFVTDVFNLISCLVAGLHDQRGMNSETLNFLARMIDYWTYRHQDELPWRFGRRLCSYLLRLDRQSANPIDFEFALSAPFTFIFMEYLRADYPRTGFLPITIYPGDTEGPPNGGSNSRSRSTSTTRSTRVAIESGTRLMSDLPREQLTRAIAGGTQTVDCVICQNSIVLRTFVIRLPCGHYYHPSCIAQTFYHMNPPGGGPRRCPLCRYDCGLPPELEPELELSTRKRPAEEPEEAEERQPKRARRTRGG